MAMGRGLTLQCGDDAVNLTRSWNTRETRLGAESPKPGLSRKPDASFHNKKHGGHFQLAVNFQSRASPPNQLITPASLISSAAKEADQARDAFEDAHSEEDDVSDDEDSLSDDENESEDDDDDESFSDSHAKNSTSYNYSQALEEEEGHSSCDDVAAQESKSSDEELEDAIEFILQEKLEIDKRQFGFIALEDTINQNRGKKSGVEEIGKLIKPRCLSNTSSDKENIDVQNNTPLKSSQTCSQKSSYQNSIPGEKKPISYVEKGIPKQPFKTSEKQNVPELSVKKDFPTRLPVSEQGAVNSLQERWGQNREREKKKRAGHETGENENKKDTLTGEQIMNHTPPSHKVTDSGKETSKETSLSPHAAPFVPITSTSCSLKGRAQGVDAVTESTVGPQTEPSLWSSEYDSQQVNSPQTPDERTLLPKTKDFPAPTNPVGSPLRQTASKLSDKELENEYEWRKYKLIRKVKQILKPQTSDDGKISLPDNCDSQLCNAMTEASSSFAIFTSYPKELVIVLEEVIRQSVEETVLDDVYQKDFIELFHKLSAFSPHFDQDFKRAIKHVEKLFLQPFIGAHLEKLGLRYCQFLGRLYGSFCQMALSTKGTLEEIIFALCKKWIIFNEKGTNLNAEVTELTFAKCLQAITKEIGPFCPREKWKQLMADVKGQIFSGRAQNVKEIFLEILLHSESVTSDSSYSESATSESVSSSPSKIESPPSESVVNDPSKLKCAKSKQPRQVEGEYKEKDVTDQNLPQKTSSQLEQSELNIISGDTRQSVEHSRLGTNTSRESQSGSESTRRDSSPYRSPYNDSTKATYLSTKLRASSLHNKEKDIKNISQPNPPVRKKMKEKEHSVGGNGDQGSTKVSLSKKGEPCDWWDYDAARQQQRTAEVIQEEKNRAEEENKAEVMVDTHENPTDTTGEADQGIGMEKWDEELIPNPPPLMYPSATKRFIDGNSLRFQREQYELNISSAAKTYEVYAGDSGESLLQGVATSGDNIKGIQQSDDDVVILENSDSDDDDDDGDDDIDNEEVPMIWGDDLADIPQRQAPVSNVSATGTRGPLSHPLHTFGQKVEINRTMCNSPWNSRPMVVFQEEEDTESSLSKIEILAQKALEEQRRLGGTPSWQNVKFSTEGKDD